MLNKSALFIHKLPDFIIQTSCIESHERQTNFQAREAEGKVFQYKTRAQQTRFNNLNFKFLRPEFRRAVIERVFCRLLVYFFLS